MIYLLTLAIGIYIGFKLKDEPCEDCKEVKNGMDVFITNKR